jgi:hypothetical protein
MKNRWIFTIFFFSILLSLPGLSAENDDDTRLTKNKVNPSQTFDEVLDKKDTLLRNEALIEEKDPKTGVYDYQYYTGQDMHKVSLLFHLSHDISSISEIMGFEAQFEQRVSNRLWMGLLLSRIFGRWDSMGENPVGTSTNVDAEVNNPRDPVSKQTVTSFGGGLSYRFRMPDQIITTEGLFQTVSAYVTWNTALDEMRQKDYRGPGFRADYGLHKRFAHRWYLGVRGSYQKSFVKRGSIGTNETGSERRYNLSWITIAADAGIYF